MARKPLLDQTLAKAIEPARKALLEITDESLIGEHLEAVNDGERLVTHRFAALRPGYEGWCWFATLTRIPRAQAKDLTVCEVGIVPGEGALLAPPWVPWAERVSPEERDAERSAAEEAAAAASGAEASAGEPSEGQSTGEISDGYSPGQAAEADAHQPDSENPK